MTTGPRGRKEQSVQPPRTPRSAGRSRGRAPPEQPAEVSDLLSRASAGDEEAWREIVRLYAKRVFGLARSRRLGTEAAEEVTQSVLVTVAQNLRNGGYSERGRFESWLFRIAINRVRDEIRRVARQAGSTDPMVLAQGALAGAPIERDEPALHALRAALAQLGEQDREVVDLRHHGGLSFKQIAEALGEPLGTVLARHHRALRKIKELMMTGSDGSGTTPMERGA